MLHRAFPGENLEWSWVREKWTRLYSREQTGIITGRALRQVRRASWV